MILLRELFRGQLVELDHFTGEELRLVETFSVEHDLCDKLIRWDHHSDGSEEHLEVIRELSSTSVARVHRDVTAKLRFDLERFALEVEFLDTRQKSFPDLLKLLGNDRQHLNEDTVELIKTSPAALHSETTEMLLHHLIIDLIGTIVHDTEDGNTLGQILCRLSLAGTGRTSGVSAELDMKGTGDGNPALVSQGCDDQTGLRSQVLEAVEEHGLYLADNAQSLRCATRALLNFLVGVAQLLLPVEIIDGLDSGLLKLLNDGLRVHIDSDEGGEL